MFINGIWFWKSSAEKNYEIICKANPNLVHCCSSSGIDFTNNTQYSTSSWFQRSWRAVTDQLCRMESCHEPIFCHHKLSIGLRSGLFAGHVIEMKGLFWKKAITLFALWQDTLASWKIYLSSLNLFPVNWMRKVSKISMYTCALTP